MRFLADECCDYAAVRALREAGHEVQTISETAPESDDGQVMDLAASQGRILVTENKDFGQLVYAAARQASGVVLLRFPGNARSAIDPTLVSAVERLGDRAGGNARRGGRALELAGRRVEPGAGRSLQVEPVLAACGWTDLKVPPFATPETEPDRRLEQFTDDVIDRLFVLNAQRAEQKRREGLDAMKPRKATKPPPRSRNAGRMGRVGCFRGS